MPKSEERRSNIVSSSSSSPRFFSWKSRNSSTKRHQQQQQQQQQQQYYQHQQQSQSHPPISMSSPSSPLMMEKEQISSCSSPQLVRLNNTPKPIHIDETRVVPTIKNDIRKIDENGHQSDMDEHIQIALYAQQLASVSDKHKQNPTGIPPPIRFPSCPMNLQMNNHQYHPRMMTTTPSSTMIPMSSIRSMHMDHQSAEKRLIISKLEAKNR